VASAVDISGTLKVEELVVRGEKGSGREIPAYEGVCFAAEYGEAVKK
jgi:hypothetical protein